MGRRILGHDLCSATPKLGNGCANEKSAMFSAMTYLHRSLAAGLLSALARLTILFGMGKSSSTPHK